MQQLLYKEAPTVGILVGTFAALPYVNLHLEARKRFYPEIPVLVNDDGSHKRIELQRLCDLYGVELHCNERRGRWTVGDMSCYTNGLIWANHTNLDIIVKMSRRFIPFYNWVPELQNLAVTSQAPTFSNQCDHFRFGFRTECIGLHTKTWSRGKYFNNINSYVEGNTPVFVEGHIHSIAKEIMQESNPIFLDYINSLGRTEDNSGYAVWDIMANKRTKKKHNLLWHDCNRPEDYAVKAQEFGLDYTTKDFTDPNQGAGLGQK